MFIVANELEEILNAEGWTFGVMIIVYIHFDLCIIILYNCIN